MIFPNLFVTEWMQQGVKIQETSKKQRLLNEWHGMLIKKMLYTRSNLILLVCLIILPIVAAVLILIIDLLDKQETTNMPSFSDLTLYPNPYVVRDHQRTYLKENEFEILDDRSLENSAEYDKVGMLAGATLIGIRNGVEDYLLDKIDLNEEGFEKTYVAAATFRHGSVTAWYNRRLVHGSPTSLSLIYKTVGHVLANIDIEIINKPRDCSDILTQVKQIEWNAEKFSAFILIYLSIAMGTFIILPIQERVWQMKHQQFLSGISLCTYWLSHLLWDYLIFLILVVSLIISFYQKSPSVLYCLLLCLLAFAFAALPYIYLMSFTFKTPYLGLTVMVLFNIVVGNHCLNSLMHFNDSLTKFLLIKKTYHCSDCVYYGKLLFSLKKIF